MPVVLAGPPAPLPSDEVPEVGGELVAVRLPGHGLEAPVTAKLVIGNLPHPPASGATLSMFVRPSAVHIVAPHEAQLMARVRDVAFCGRGYEHALDNDGTLLLPGCSRKGVGSAAAPSALD